MRLQSPSTVTVRHKVIGGPSPLVCLPLVADDAAALMAQAETVVALKPDLVEWRVDKFQELQSPEPVMAALPALRRALGEIPVIFTCRIVTEGGFQPIDADTRLAIDLAAIASGQIDVIDAELANDPAMIAAIRDACRQSGVKLILSSHDFEKTPEAAAIVEKLCQAEALGADIAKVAAMPQTHQDVLTLLEATYVARRGAVKIPIITMSMAGLGAVSRVAGGLFGADVTFAVGAESSAPGQIPIADLRAAWRALGIL